MSKPQPCKHTRWKRIKLVAYDNHTEEGQPPPGPRQKFRVLEILRCVKCDDAGNRWTRFYGQTARAALKRAGVPDPELPAPANHKEKPPVTVPLSCWPFPVSTVYPKEPPP